ncbi:hypothetical protein COT52_00600 [candidate division WWE3 bacterium CG08_land_8_20_14_0_20_43_13]|uniref:4Fe-4S ferredoxin-type domain-containing protein n=1 Tax=candidate division WWE3 bacterium CG08_land_8_20_14_0_20_43_13 TaxID=1975087 RepID=A0A2H0X7Y0_UNCKA|nr:MAG: hypothetical protein COT52_00600 [candidate division WWE3 bacterium CG08_land_8_20_14_0_20_43_13]
MKKYLPNGNIPLLIRELQNKFQVYAPQLEGKQIAFKHLVFPERVRLDYSLSFLPPAKLIIPFSYSKESATNKQKQLLFGVHLADLDAINYLDRIFSQPINDPIYQNIRKNFVIVGVDYPQQKDAFFTDQHEYLKSRCDLFLDKINNGYLAIPGTLLGQELLKSKYFEVITSQKYQPADKVNGNDLLKNIPALKKAVLNKNHPIWEEMAQKCLGCGICSYVCPLCFCFDREEKNTLTQPPQQLRRASSCLLKSFHAIAGGSNFAPTIKERFYNWYYHKFVRMVDEYGQPGCVGCNRCSTYCPAGINIYENLQRLIEQ